MPDDFSYQEPGVALVDEPEAPEAHDFIFKQLLELRAIKAAIITAFNLNARDFEASNFLDD
jgi:hypothetical protein